MQIFMFVGVSVIEILLFNRKKKKQKQKMKNMATVKISITCITPVLQAILDFFPDIISFQHVFHLGVGRSQIRWKLKVKTLISVFPLANIGQNDHSNPYIESTTVLSDIWYKDRSCVREKNKCEVSMSSITFPIIDYIHVYTLMCIYDCVSVSHTYTLSHMHTLHWILQCA